MLHEAHSPLLTIAVMPDKSHFHGPAGSSCNKSDHEAGTKYCVNLLLPGAAFQQVLSYTLSVCVPEDDRHTLG